MSRNPLDLGCLRLFATAARHENLSKAAESLGMTQPALSYRIREMERRLGRPLFERRHRGLALSSAGRLLQEAAEAALRQLDEAVETLARAPRGRSVRLATDYAFAALWLMPRVAAFRAEHPDCDLQIVASQRLADGSAAEADLAVLFGSRRDVGPRALPLLPERVVALASPALIAEHGPFGEVAALAAAPLLHLEGEGRGRWFDWPAWLAGLGGHAPAGRGLTFNTYTLVIQAALAGQGVALGWLGLVDPLLESGALRQAHPAALESERGYWLLRGRAEDAAARSAADWILAGCAAA